MAQVGKRLHRAIDQEAPRQGQLEAPGQQDVAEANECDRRARAVAVSNTSAASPTKPSSIKPEGTGENAAGLALPGDLEGQKRKRVSQDQQNQEPTTP